MIVFNSTNTDSQLTTNYMFTSYQFLAANTSKKYVSHTFKIDFI